MNKIEQKNSRKRGVPLCCKIWAPFIIMLMSELFPHAIEDESHCFESPFLSL